MGSLKGVGRIYQQTFIDTYTKLAMVGPLLENNVAKGACGAKAEQSRGRACTEAAHDNTNP